METMQILAANVRRLRGEAHLTQNQLATMAGLSRAAIAQIEMCRYGTTRIDVLERIAKAFGVDANVLLSSPPSVEAA